MRIGSARPSKLGRAVQGEPPHRQKRTYGLTANSYDVETLTRLAWQLHPSFRPPLAKTRTDNRASPKRRRQFVPIGRRALVVGRACSSSPDLFSPESLRTTSGAKFSSRSLGPGARGEPYHQAELTSAMVRPARACSFFLFGGIRKWCNRPTDQVDGMSKYGLGLSGVG